MRPLLIPLLLLWTLLAAADVQNKCDRSHVKGVNVSEIDIFDTNHITGFELKCHRSENSLKAIMLNSVLYDSIHCIPWIGWVHYVKDYVHEEIAQNDYSNVWNVTCVEYCKVEGQGIKVLLEKHRVVVRCHQNKVKWGQLYYNGKQVEKYSAICSKDHGWYTTENETSILKEHDHFMPLQLECRTGPPVCDSSLIKGVASNQLKIMTQYWMTTVEFSCQKSENGMKVIIFNSTRYKFLECHRDNGWESLGLPADAQLTVACEEYCAVAGTGLQVRVPEGVPVAHYIYKLSTYCTNKLEHLYHGEKWGGQEAICTMKGWDNFPSADITKPLQLDCRTGPCSFNGEGVEFDFATKALTCRRRNGGVRLLTYNSMVFQSLTCDQEHGWRGQNLTTEGRISEAFEIEMPSSPTLNCIEYCISTRKGFLFGPRNGRERKLNINIVSCENKFQYFENQRIDGALCLPGYGWYTYIMGHNQMLRTDTIAPMNFECRKDPPPCSFVATLHVQFDNDTKTLNCRDGENTLQIEFNSNRYHSLTCDNESGWKGKKFGALEAIYIAETTATLDATCVKYPPLCSFRAAFHVQFDSDTKTLTCRGGENTLQMIEFNSNRYHSLTCDEVSGWKGKKFGALEAVYIAESAETLDATCVKYCETTGTNFLSDKIFNGIRAIDCENLQLFVNGQKVDDSSAQCEEDGWWIEGKQIADNATPLHLDCRAACTPDESADLLVNTSAIGTDRNATEFACKNESGELHLLKINGKFIGYPLKCHPDTGYIDVYGEKIADAYNISKWECLTARSQDHLLCTLKKWEKNQPESLLASYRKLNSRTKTLTCTDYKRPMAISVQSVRFLSLTCDAVRGWRDDKDNKIADSTIPLDATCEEYCVSTGERLTSRLKNWLENIVEVNCDKDKFLYVENQRMDGAKCLPEYGWYTERLDQQIVLRTETVAPMHFECRTDPPLCPFLATLHIHFDSDTKTLTCRGGENTLLTIEFHSNRYHSLTCDEESGWKGKKFGALDEVYLAESTETLDAICVKYCEATGTNFVSDIITTYREIDCENLQLFVNGQKADDSSAQCEEDGWWIDGEQIADNATPLHLDCRAEPAETTIQTATRLHNQQIQNAPILTAATGEHTTLIYCAIGVFLFAVILVICRAKSSGIATSRRVQEEERRTKRSGSSSNKSTRREVGNVPSEH